MNDVLMSSGPGPSRAAGGGTIATAAGWIALLQEEDSPELVSYALQQLLQAVDTLWHEVAECLPELEALAEDTTLPAAMRQTAAAVASRVFFHLEEPTQSLRLALEAGPEHFDPRMALPNNAGTTTAASTRQDTHNPYVERLVQAALDAYIAQRQAALDHAVPVAAAGSGAAVKAPSTTLSSAASSKGKKKAAAAVDASAAAADVGISMEQLQQMVHRLLEASCEAGNFPPALGIALEARETEQLQKLLQASGPDWNLLHYALTVCLQTVTSKAYRQEALAVIAKQLETLLQLQDGSSTSTTHQAAATDLLTCYQLLHDSEAVSNLFARLFRSANQLDYLLGLQLTFDLMDAGDFGFIQAVATHFLQQQQQQPSLQPASDNSLSNALLVQDETVLTARWKQAERVLAGGFPSELALSFLHKHSHADRFIMEQLKRTLEERSSGSRLAVLHHAAVMTHAYLYFGTTNDSFLREYLDWMKKASNWAKFSATASLGLIHCSHITEAMRLLEPYLPSNPVSADGSIEVTEAVSPTGGYAEGGSLYALGLIHACQPGTNQAKRHETTEFLRAHLRVSHANEVISHGAALGVGLTAMGTANVAIVDELKELLDTDSAVAGEAAGIAIGMVLAGTGAGNAHPNLPASMTASQREELNELTAELKNYARETQHEKIIRGIAMALAMIQLGQEEHADACIEEMRADRDPVMRYGAQYAIALAYCGTGSNKAIRILLHTAVSDVSDDVRMAAVLGLAFVLFQTPERVPELVKLLLESFNPHVRYASCMAVGIAMAGTGDSESIAMLEPMLDDMTDYVRQGALIGTALIYMQQSDTCNNRKIKSFRERLSVIVTEKHQSVLTKMGAILSTGILDAGGRNCALQLGCRTAGTVFVKQSAAIGLALWLQHWHWYPLMHLFGMALTPTYTMGLTASFKYPKQGFSIICHAKPSQFAYPKKMEEKKEEKKKRVETVTLSTTAKEKARLARKRAKMGGAAAAAAGATTAAADAMDLDTSESKKEEGVVEGSDSAKKDDAAASADAMDVDKPTPAVEKPRKKREPEPTQFVLGNPARITTAQAAFCTVDDTSATQRYRPIRGGDKLLGVILVTDSQPDQEDEEMGTVQSPSLEPEGELPPPEPFEWVAPDVNEDNEDDDDDDESKDKKMSAATSTDDDDDEAAVKNKTE